MQKHQVQLGDVPDGVWDEIASRGFNIVWLMGVWERSPAGLALACGNPELWASFLATLPDLRTGLTKIAALIAEQGQKQKEVLPT